MQSRVSRYYGPVCGTVAGTVAAPIRARIRVPTGAAPVPPVKFYLSPGLYAELERQAREAGVTIPQLVKRLVEDWLEGRLCSERGGTRVDEGRLRELERRVELLEETVKALLRIVAGR